MVTYEYELQNIHCIVGSFFLSMFVSFSFFYLHVLVVNLWEERATRERIRFIDEIKWMRCTLFYSLDLSNNLSKMCYYCFLLIILSRICFDCVHACVRSLCRSFHLGTSIAVEQTEQTVAAFFLSKIYATFEYSSIVGMDGCWFSLFLQVLLYAYTIRVLFFWSIYSSITEHACIYVSRWMCPIQ